MPLRLLPGFLAALATYVFLYFAFFGLFVSVGGLMIAALVAYAAGAVAAAPRSVNILAAAVYIPIVFVAARKLPLLLFAVWVAPGGELIVFLIAHTIGSIAASLIDPIWRSWKHALLAVLVFALPVAYVIERSSSLPPPGAAPGGENRNLTPEGSR